MSMMKENVDGNMEFPRDVVIEDCFSGGPEPLFGFVSNVTIPEDMLRPCIVGKECFANGTRIKEEGEAEESVAGVNQADSRVRRPRSINNQGNNLKLLITIIVHTNLNC